MINKKTEVTCAFLLLALYGCTQRPANEPNTTKQQSTVATESSQQPQLSENAKTQEYVQKLLSNEEEFSSHINELTSFMKDFARGKKVDPEKFADAYRPLVINVERGKSLSAPPNCERINEFYKKVISERETAQYMFREAVIGGKRDAMIPILKHIQEANRYITLTADEIDRLQQRK